MLQCMHLPSVCLPPPLHLAESYLSFRSAQNLFRSICSATKPFLDPSMIFSDLHGFWVPKILICTIHLAFAYHLILICLARSPLEEKDTNLYFLSLTSASTVPCVYRTSRNWLSESAFLAKENGFCFGKAQSNKRDKIGDSLYEPIIDKILVTSMCLWVWDYTHGRPTVRAKWPKAMVGEEACLFCIFCILSEKSFMGFYKESDPADGERECIYDYLGIGYS